MRNNEGEWFKTLLATGGCSLLLTLFLLLLPLCLFGLSKFQCFSLSALVFWLMFCNDGKCSSLMSCFLGWYALFCFLLFLFYVLLSFLLFSRVWFSTLTIFEDVNTFFVNEETEMQNVQKGFTERNSIGPLNPLWNQNLTIHPVHSGFLDLGLRSPIWPVHEPAGSKQTKHFYGFEL